VGFILDIKTTKRPLLRGLGQLSHGGFKFFERLQDISSRFARLFGVRPAFLFPEKFLPRG